MIARLSWGRFGASYWCPECGEMLDPFGDDYEFLRHPTKAGLLRKPSTCSFAGKAFERPMHTIELKETKQ